MIIRGSGRQLLARCHDEALPRRGAGEVREQIGEIGLAGRDLTWKPRHAKKREGTADGLTAPSALRVLIRVEVVSGYAPDGANLTYAITSPSLLTFPPRPSINTFRSPSPGTSVVAGPACSLGRS